MRVKGMYTALITPFRQGEIDEKGLRLSLRRQLDAEVDGLVILGTTGEAASLSAEERKRLISLTVAEVATHVPIAVGCSHNCTAAAIDLAIQARELGADLGLCVTPYYCRPTQDGIIKHFQALAEQSKLPLLLYNNPGRTGTAMHPDTVQALASHPAILGIKDASGDPAQISRLLAFANESFTVLSGDEVTILPWMSLGAAGVVSGGANAAPRMLTRLVRLIQQEQWEQARQLHLQLGPFFHFLSVESNPIPLKALLTHMSLPSGGCRLPMTELSGAHHSTMKNVAQLLDEEVGSLDA